MNKKSTFAGISKAFGKLVDGTSAYNTPSKKENDLADIIHSSAKM